MEMTTGYILEPTNDAASTAAAIAKAFSQQHNLQMTTGYADAKKMSTGTKVLIGGGILLAVYLVSRAL